MFEIKLLFLQLLYNSFFFPTSFAGFDYKIGSCSFEYHPGKCDLSKVEKREIIPKGYYWRPYIDGIIPLDAYQISKPSQKPRTFVGLVYDTSQQGTVIVTIVEGMNTVLSISIDGKVNELHDDIKILCTKQPDKFYWYNASDPNRPPSKNFHFIRDDGHISTLTSGSARKVNPFVVITMNCKNAYATSVLLPSETSKFVTLEGVVKSSPTYVFLVFPLITEADDDKGMKKTPYISHRYKYSMRPDSIIPSYYKFLKIGSFSILCTNEGGKKGSLSTKLPNYFWTPKEFFSEKVALPFGNNGNGQTYYAAQTADIKQLGVNVGTTTNGQTNYILYRGTTLIYQTAVLTLGTTNPERFAWVPTTSAEFSKLNTTKMIRGGYLPDGTKIYVGRAYSDGMTYPASIKKLGDSSLASYTDTHWINGETDKFDVLFYRES